MSMYHPGLNCYCNFCGAPVRFQIARVGETVNCLNCCMETVLFIPGMEAPYSENQIVLEAREIKWSEDKFHMRHLEGVLENKSLKHMNWVRIEFVLFDQAGLAVGSTSDCLISVAPKRVWRFRAPVCQTEARHVSEPLISCEYGRLTRPQTIPKTNGAARLTNSLR